MKVLSKDNALKLIAVLFVFVVVYETTYFLGQSLNAVFRQNFLDTGFTQVSYPVDSYPDSFPGK